MLFFCILIQWSVGYLCRNILKKSYKFFKITFSPPVVISIYILQAMANMTLFHKNVVSPPKIYPYVSDNVLIFHCLFVHFFFISNIWLIKSKHAHSGWKSLYIVLLPSGTIIPCLDSYLKNTKFSKMHIK